MMDMHHASGHDDHKLCSNNYEYLFMWIQSNFVSIYVSEINTIIVRYRILEVSLSIDREYTQLN